MRSKLFLIVMALGLFHSTHAQQADIAQPFAYLVGQDASGAVILTEALPIAMEASNDEIMAQFKKLPANAVKDKWSVVRCANMAEAKVLLEEARAKYQQQGIRLDRD